MEEQLSGSCTVEIASFNEFSRFITDAGISAQYDHVIFDTAPTGHTLRMMELPSAWTNFLNENTTGASCLGQLSGLQDKRATYQQAVNTLSDSAQTTLVLVARPEETPLKEAARASGELADIGVRNQFLIINGVLKAYDDAISEGLYRNQQKALDEIPEPLRGLSTYFVPLRSYNITGVENVRAFLNNDVSVVRSERLNAKSLPRLQDVIDDLYSSGKKVIFTMGKGGVGKTTIAAAIALGLTERGRRVHLTTTDPAAHLRFVVTENSRLTMSHIDEQAELEKYKAEVLGKARKTMSAEDVAYVEEDLRSPCTQEIAVFRAFAEIVGRAENEVVVIDTAPTGHTLLLLESTESYNRQMQHSQGDIPESALKLLPRLKNAAETEVVIVTLPEPTPVYEALRLEEDLKRAGIQAKWWIINSSLYRANTTSGLLRAKASTEVEWINRVDEHTRGKLAVVGWNPTVLKGDKLLEL
jgi:arsenite-transporting ATPase